MSRSQRSLPDEVKDSVDEQVVRGHLRALLQAGIDSGEPLEVDDNFWPA